MSATPRVRAPEFQGRGWLNTDGPLTLRSLRGRIVLLDFWTFCCINCLHVLDELRAVEEEFPDELVVIGVHSPKFVHEADPSALAAAVERYGVAHPVLDDPELITWQNYAARAWPTLVLIDPEGYVVAHYSGEGHAHALSAMIGELVARHRSAGTLQPGDSPYVAPEPEESDLRFPAKAIALPNGHLLVADAGHHQVVELALGAEPPSGSDRPLFSDRPLGDDSNSGDDVAFGDRACRDPQGEPALTDERPLGDRACRDQVVRRFDGFTEPNGLCLLPDDVAAQVGYEVVVADTGGHRLSGITLATGEVRPLAGDGTQWFQGDGTQRLSSPWDVAWWQDRVWMAMAGVHQLWTFDPLSGVVEIAAGTSNEGLVDGAVDQAWFAQTSGLASDGERLWLVDAETSSLRYIEEQQVHTVIGQGLFDFGFKDGGRDVARLQHPLGVAVLPDASIAICDTYNGALRRFDPKTGHLATITSGLAEPSGLVMVGETAYVVESTAHQVAEVGLDTTTASTGFEARTQRPLVDIAVDLEVRVGFLPPPGQQVDDRFGPASQLIISATPSALIRSGDGRGTDLTRSLRLDPAVGEGVLHIAARAASCDSAGGEGAACRMHQQDWGVPVQITEDGPALLALPLGGTENN